MPLDYKYRPLAEARIEIRLLKLNPPPTEPRHQQQISGSLHHVSLDERPSFKALSYAWGDLTASRYPINVDGNTLMITQNLRDALEMLQTLPRIPVLWIDAVCINQADEGEKGTQVPLMRRIYGEAEEVLIWLGLAAHQSTETIQLLLGWGHKFSALLEQHGRDHFHPDVPLRQLMTQITHEFPVAQWLVPVAKFFKRSWWHRVWVRQEVILAKAAILYCGDVAVAWSDMERTIEMFSYPQAYRHLEIEQLGLKIGQLAVLRRLRLDYLGRYRNWVPGLTWEKLLSIIASPSFKLKVTDERDKLYGLMGLLLEEERAKVPVDYSNASTLETISFHVSRAMIGRTGPKCLIYCNDANPQPSSIASWVPNWYSCNPMCFYAWDDVYDAAKGTNWTPKLLSVSLSNPKLKLKGVLVGVISKTLAMETISFSESKRTLQNFKSWESSLASALRTTAAAEDGGSAESFCNKLWWLAVLGIPDSRLVSRAIKEPARRQLLASYEVFVGSREIPDSLDDDKRQYWYETESGVYRMGLKIDKYRPFVTLNGLPGMGQPSTQTDDRVVVFEGCSVPFTIRQRERGDHCLIGPCFVLGIMDGEVMANRPQFEEIVLA